jgi:hypothetical protein
MQDMLALIAEQQRELNSAFNAFAQATGERLASLETSMTALVGGQGQPGMMAGFQAQLLDLQRWRWKMAGITTGVATVVSGIVTTVGLLLKV